MFALDLCFIEGMEEKGFYLNINTRHVRRCCFIHTEDLRFDPVVHGDNVFP